MKKFKLNSIILTSSLATVASLSIVITSCGSSTKTDDTVANFEYVETSGGYAITGISNTDKTKIKTITVPEKYNNKDVVKIDKGAFAGCGNVTEVSIPFVGISKTTTSNVNKMFGNIFGDTVFDGVSTFTWQFCESDTNNDISYGKFAIPDSLTKVTITSGDDIPSGAFSSCKNLETITINKTNTSKSIGSYAFYGCSSLEKFDFSFNSKLESVGYCAFMNCYSLQSIELNAEMKTLGSYSFANCLSTSKAYIPANVDTVGSGCFNNLPSIILLRADEATINERMSKGTWKSDWCDESASVVYGYTNDSLHYKDNFMILTCGSGTNRYGYIAQWMGSWQQQTISVPSSYEVDGTTLPIKAIGSLVFSGNESINYLNINENIEKICPNAFENCYNLYTLILPSTLKTIGANAFYGCTNLRYSYKDSQLYDKVKLYNVETIGPRAFYGCSSIRELDLGCVKTIGDEAFAYCTHLCPDYTTDETNCLLIPATVTSLGEGAFKWCFKYVQDGIQTTPYYPTIRFGAGSTLAEIPDNCFENCGVRVTRPTTGLDAGTVYPSQIRINLDFNGAPITRIGDYAFNNMWMSKLSGARKTKITYIGDYAFYYTQPTSEVASSTMESLQIDQECEYIGDWAFAYCTTIQELKFLTETEDESGTTVDKGFNSLKHLGQYAFYGCSNQNFSDLDLSVCTELTNITVGETEGTYTASNTPRYAFAQCTNLMTVELPGSVATKPCTSFTRLPERMFEGCTKLGIGGSITIPSNITDIRACVFNGCQYLENAYIDGTIEYYGSSIFNNNYKLKTVTKTGGDDVAFANNLKRENIGSNQYYNCRNLTKAPIPMTNVVPTTDYYYNVPSSAFYNCEKLESIDLSTANNRIYAVGSYAFFGCSILKTITFPERSSMSFGEKAFSGCTSLGTNSNKFVLPKNTIYMGSNVFENWNAETQTVYFTTSNCNWKGTAGTSNFTLKGTSTWEFVYNENSGNPYWTCANCGNSSLKFKLND